VHWNLEAKTIGPYFFSGNITGKWCLHMLQNFVGSIPIWFQQAGAPHLVLCLHFLT